MTTRRILVIIENVAYARDHRARKQVESLLRSGYRVGVISRRDPDNHRYRSPGLRIYEYKAPPERPGLIGFALEYWLLPDCRDRADGSCQASRPG